MKVRDEDWDEDSTKETTEKKREKRRWIWKEILFRIINKLTYSNTNWEYEDPNKAGLSYAVALDIE